MNKEAWIKRLWELVSDLCHAYARWYVGDKNNERRHLIKALDKHLEKMPELEKEGL